MAYPPHRCPACWESLCLDGSNHDQGDSMSVDSIPGYAAVYSSFHPEDLAEQLSGNLESGLNVCYECCDRHAATGKTALFWEGKAGRSATYTFAELQALAAQF